MFNYAELAHELFQGPGYLIYLIYPFLSTLGSLPKLLAPPPTTSFIRWHLVWFPGESYKCEFVNYI